TLVGNLLDNAMEAARQVWVEVADDADGLLVRVSDSGPGVPAERIGEIFTRGHTTKDGAGRGLGLALVDQIVRRNGGTVSVTERVGGGAVFEVRIPRARREETAHAAPGS